MKRILYFLLLAALLPVCCKKQAPERVWTDSSIVYELNVRQFTPEGTFAAAQKQLPRLKALGVDIIWLMPIYPIGELERKGSLGSYYAIRDYCDVNPEFGSLKDFDAFLAAAHDQGFKLILDWVANHTSPDHPWVTEKPADWYYRDSLGHTIVEYDWTDIAKLNYDTPEVGAAMRECMSFWVKRGVDGFRCDVAYQVPQAFWEATIPALREEAGRGLYFLAEGEEAWLHAAGFDATYAWKLHRLVNDIARGPPTAIPWRATSSGTRWNTPEMPSVFHSPPTTMRIPGQEPNSSGWGSLESHDRALLDLPESQPLIYTGQEIGWNKRFEFFEKDPVPEWKDNEYTAFYQYLTALRHDHPALDPGSSFELLKVSPASITYRRSAGRDKVKVTVDLAEPWSYKIETN